MLAITFWPAFGFTVIGIIIGGYAVYRLFAWALSDQDSPAIPYYDENSYS